MTREVGYIYEPPYGDLFEVPMFYWWCTNAWCGRMRPASAFDVVMTLAQRPFEVIEDGDNDVLVHVQCSECLRGYTLTIAKFESDTKHDIMLQLAQELAGRKMMTAVRDTIDDLQTLGFFTESNLD